MRLEVLCGCLELAERGAGAATSAEACIVDPVLHRTRQESTISDSLDIRLLYRRHPAELDT